jgi:hypothetical protein
MITLLDYCKSGIQLSNEQITAIIALIAKGKRKPARDRLASILNDTRGISKIGLLSHVVIEGDNAYMHSGSYQRASIDICNHLLSD